MSHIGLLAASVIVLYKALNHVTHELLVSVIEFYKALNHLIYGLLVSLIEFYKALNHATHWPNLLLCIIIIFDL